MLPCSTNDFESGHDMVSKDPPVHSTGGLPDSCQVWDNLLKNKYNLFNQILIQFKSYNNLYIPIAVRKGIRICT